jgi:hypothetical protein
VQAGPGAPDLRSGIAMSESHSTPAAPLYWSKRGDVACADHAPKSDNPRVVAEGWTPIAAYGRVLYQCSACRGTPLRHRKVLRSAAIRPLLPACPTCQQRADVTVAVFATESIARDIYNCADCNTSWPGDRDSTAPCDSHRP